MYSDINIKVNRDLCYACGECVERCILDNLRLAVAPCRRSCPISMNCQGYIRLMDQGREEEAAREMRRYTPFGSILGRVCHHPCEEVCERRKTDGAVHIRALKHYLAETYPEIAFSPGEVRTETGKTIAIVGSGPAGLMAAYDLRLLGHGVTVYEAETGIGGMLRYAIPEFRLPLAEVDRAVKILLKMGVGFKTGAALGKEVELAKLEAKNDALVLACGGGGQASLGLAYENHPRVLGGLAFLRDVKSGERPDLGGSVVVIGGGNTAVDAAITCRRLGTSDVRLICLEARDNMPAFNTAVQEAIDEAVSIENSCGAMKFAIESENRLTLELAHCLAVFDNKGCFNPVLAKESLCTLKTDHIILATGQKPDFSFLPGEMLDEATGFLKVNRLTGQSLARPKVFICGDALSGPCSVVEAFASGREAALSVGRFLSGEGLEWGRGGVELPWIDEYRADPVRIAGGPRKVLAKPSRTPDNPLLIMEHALSPQEAKEEAMRCLSCGQAAEINLTCWFCLPCEIECPVDALEVKMPYLVR